MELTDIKDHWAKSSIEQAVKLGFVTGYEDGTFKANRHATRGEFSAMLARALKLELDHMEFGLADQDQTPPWAQPFIQAMANAGYVSGYEDGSFRTQNEISRTEAVVIIVRALGLEIDPNASIGFEDADQISAWARPYIAAAEKAGIVKGNGKGQFNPAKSATRAEVITLIMSMLDYEQ